MRIDDLNGWNWGDLQGQRLELHFKSREVLDGLLNGVTGLILHLLDVNVYENRSMDERRKAESAQVHLGSVTFCISLGKDVDRRSVMDEDYVPDI